MDNIALYEHSLLKYATEQLKTIEGMRIFGEAPDKGAVVSMQVGNIHHYDMGTLLDKLGIALRTGHHCAQPVMDYYGIEGTLRASFALYNTKEEIDMLIYGINRAQKLF
jgi:cysteine desulfurase/selenocysteine lyase